MPADATTTCPRCRADLVAKAGIGHAVVRVCVSELCAHRARQAWFSIVEVSLTAAHGGVDVVGRNADRTETF